MLQSVHFRWALFPLCPVQRVAAELQRVLFFLPIPFLFFTKLLAIRQICRPDPKRNLLFQQNSQGYCAVHITFVLFAPQMNVKVPYKRDLSEQASESSWHALGCIFRVELNIIFNKVKKFFKWSLLSSVIFSISSLPSIESKVNFTAHWRVAAELLHDTAILFHSSNELSLAQTEMSSLKSSSYSTRSFRGLGQHLGWCNALIYLNGRDGCQCLAEACVLVYDIMDLPKIPTSEQFLTFFFKMTAYLHQVNFNDFPGWWRTPQFSLFFHTCPKSFFDSSGEVVNHLRLNNFSFSKKCLQLDLLCS